MKDLSMLLHPMLVLIFTVSTALAQTARADDVESKLAEYMDASVRVRKFQGSVLVAKDGKILLRQAYGLANIEHDVLNTPETKFRLGSITKQFTAMAIMILQERGKLKADDLISKHLGDTPEAWKDITIHHLLTHTSGIPSYTSDPSYMLKMMMPVTVDEMIARFKDKPLEFKPGSKFAYDNSGYFLLGKIIEKVSGESYEAFLDKAIFKPIGMNNTGYDHLEPILKHRASGYRRKGSKLVNDAYLEMSQPYAAGSLYSTVDDLLIWDRALAAGKLISKDLYTQMFTPFKSNYAYGWTVKTDKVRKEISHGGGINGFQTMILRYPDQGVLAVVLCNVIPSDPARVAHELAAIILGDSISLPREHKEVSIDPKVFDAYAGRYEFAPGVVWTISREGDRLIAEPNPRLKFHLRPMSETDFFVQETDAEFSFLKNSKGEITQVVSRRGPQESKGKRLAPDDKGDKPK
jgi:CubicO group peptidase (beta-lactamase class C family)